jgi:pilus assembly protein TadC
VAANRLGVRLVVPLGLATLPAFVLWAVAPVALGLAQQALAGG